MATCVCLQVDKKSSEGSALGRSLPMISPRHQSAAAAEVLMLARNANSPSSMGSLNVVRGVRAASKRTGGFVIARGKRTRTSAPWRDDDMLMMLDDHDDNKKSQRHGYVISRGRKRTTMTGRLADAY